MRHLVFIVNGYGVPKDIFKDDNYHFYLNMVFNRIWDISHLQQKYYKKVRPGQVVVLSNMSVLIIFSGGPTDCFPPYRRTEAGEMKKLFAQLMRRDSVRKVTQAWKLVEEKKSLSTLENFLNTKSILTKRKITRGKLTIFHEWRRRQRVRKTARLVLTDFDVRCVAVDFDASANRYLSGSIFRNKEQKSYKMDLWALEDLKERMKEYHRFYTKKIKFLRKSGGKNQQKALKEWWEKRLINL